MSHLAHHECLPLTTTTEEDGMSMTHDETATSASTNTSGARVPLDQSGLLARR